jgi:hypothetical protein
MAKNDYWVDTGACEPQKPVTTKKDTKTLRIVLLIVGLALAGMIAFIGLIQFILHLQKDTEEYKVAYQYFVTSDAFTALDADESEIRFNSYSANTSFSNGTKTKNVTLGFTVNFRSFEVVCHQENGVWQVCEECTHFD